MANLLQSSQTQATLAPQYYTDYLSNLASAGKDAVANAQFIGEQPLQSMAYSDVNRASSAYQPMLTSAGNTLGSAVDATSPLSAANPYLTSASTDPSRAAAGYMSPYISNVVKSIGDLGQRNIMMNLAPQATAGAVGAGQYGSKRGAEVLGQVTQNANKDILSQQYGALDKGYQTALDTAIKQNQIQAQVGNTAGTLASQGQQNLTQAGQAQGQLASTNQALELARINALATMGEQQRTIKQNRELFPLSNLSTLSGMLRGYNVPTSTKTTAEMSPLSALAGIGAGGVGLFTPGAGGKTPWDSIKAAMGSGGSGTGFDLGGGLFIKPDGSIVGGTPNEDSALTNDDLFAQTMGYRNAFDMYASGSVDNDANFYGD
jgi:hypothetical protein